MRVLDLGLVELVRAAAPDGAPSRTLRAATEGALRFGPQRLYAHRGEPPGRSGQRQQRGEVEKAVED